MKKNFVLILLLGIVVAASGCIGSGGAGSGNVVNETAKVSGFEEVVFDGTGDIIIKQGDTESLIIEAEDNVIPTIKTSVDNKKLTINYDGTIAPTKTPKFYLTVKNISSIEISGAGELNADKLNVDNLNVIVNGAANGNLNNITLKELTVSITGAGKLSASGSADKQTIVVNGAGDYTAMSLATKNTSITINGAGKGTVRASSVLNAVINGFGEINYFGNPEVTKQINGGGQINQAS